MTNLLQALPRIPSSRMDLDRCVQSVVVHDGPLTKVVQWKCHHDGEALRAERNHDTYVLSLLTAGACAVHDGRWQATLDPVTALLHRPGATYRTAHPFGCVDEGWNIAYNRETAEEILGDGDAHNERPSTAVTARPAKSAVQQLIHAHRAPDPLAMEELALELLATIAPARTTWARPTCAPQNTGEAHRRLIESTRAYLNTHRRDQLRLDELARAVGSSPAHLCRVFRSGTGMTIRNYLHRLRLAEALNAAMVPDYGLDRAAVESGFYSHSHFTSTCRRILEVTPMQVRQAALSGSSPPR